MTKRKEKKTNKHKKINKKLNMLKIFIKPFQGKKECPLYGIKTGYYSQNAILRHHLHIQKIFSFEVIFQDTFRVHITSNI